jgi:hypothetical protein
VRKEEILSPLRAVGALAPAKAKWKIIDFYEMGTQNHRFTLGGTSLESSCKAKHIAAKSEPIRVRFKAYKRERQRLEIPNVLTFEIK